jgi:hypothetical protein
MAFGGNGSVIAGAQDNGTQYKDNSMPWSKEFAEVSGGDGFECEISYLGLVIKVLPVNLFLHHARELSVRIVVLFTMLLRLWKILWI